NFQPNRYYPSREAYLHALADVMKREYNAILNAGFTLQLDTPELALSRDGEHAQLSVTEYHKLMEGNVEALNYTTAAMPAENLRMHICWGRGEGPKTSDIP